MLVLPLLPFDLFDDHQREGFVMHFPDVSIDVYNTLLGSNSQNKAMRLYPIAADVIVFGRPCGHAQHIYERSVHICVQIAR